MGFVNLGLVVIRAEIRSSLSLEGLLIDVGFDVRFLPKLRSEFEHNGSSRELPLIFITVCSAYALLDPFLP